MGLVYSKTLPASDQTVTNNTGVHGNVQADNLTISVGCSVAAPIAPLKSFRTILPPIEAFQGREALIQQIHEELTECLKETNWLKRMLVLVGFGGMGKTEVVRKFAEVHKDAYPNVAWINAECEATMVESFRKLAETLKLPLSDSEDGKEIAKKVFNHVGKHIPSSLFIFDNSNRLHTDDSAFGILEYVPKQEYTYKPLCLMTSRTTEWKADNIKTFPVDELSKDESIRFLMARFEISEPDLQRENPNSGKLGSTLQSLYACVQGYPLALQLAAANVNYVPKDDPIRLLQRRLETFVMKLKELQGSVMKKRVDRGGSDYEGNFQIIWNMTMERIRNSEYASEGIYLLQILAYTDPAGGPCQEVKEAFHLALAGENRTSDEELFDEAMSLLRRLVLVRTWNDSEDRLYTQMHRLVQSFARKDDSEGNGLRYILEEGTPLLLLYFFSSQPKLAIPPAVLQSDQLIVAWLKQWVPHKLCGKNGDKSELVFDDTHVEQLSRRKSDCLNLILAMVDVEKMLSSGELKIDEEALVSAITDVSKKGRRIFDYMLEVLYKLVREADDPFLQSLLQNFISIVTAPLVPPDEMYARKSMLLEGLDKAYHERKSELEASVIAGEGNSEMVELNRNLQDVIQNFGGSLNQMCDSIRLTQARKPFWSEPQESRFRALIDLRSSLSLRSKANVKRLLGVSDFNLKLKTYLEDTQSKRMAQLELIFAGKEDTPGGSEHPSTNHTVEQGPSIDTPLSDNDRRDSERQASWEVYMGYVISYGLAFLDYQWRGGNLIEKLHQWLPSVDYLNRLPPCLVLLASEESLCLGSGLNKCGTWDIEQDRRFLSSVLSELEKQTGPDAALHNEAIRALLRFNGLLVSRAAASHEQNSKPTDIDNIELDLD